MYPPREFLERWAYENPRQALVLLAFGACMIGFAIGLAVIP